MGKSKNGTRPSPKWCTQEYGSHPVMSSFQTLGFYGSGSGGDN